MLCPSSASLTFSTFPPEGKAKNKEINKASPWGEALPQSGGDEGQFHRRKTKNIQTNGLKKTAHFNQTIHKKICFK